MGITLGMIMMIIGIVGVIVCIAMLCMFPKIFKKQQQKLLEQLDEENGSR